MAICLLVASAWLARASYDQAKAGYVLADEVRRAQVATETLLATLTDAETGQRGYLLTGSQSYLEPYDAARQRLAADFARLRQGPLMDAARLRAIDSIQALAALKMAELERTIRLRRAGQADAALDVVRTNEGKRIMDTIRTEMDTLKVSTRSALAPRVARARSAWPPAGVFGLSALAALLLGGVALTQRQAKRSVAASLASLERFTRAFGLTHGMLLSVGGRITFWAEGMERLYGYTPNEAIGRISHELLQTRFPVALPEIQAMLLRDGQWHGELEHCRRDGSTVVVASHWALHRGMQGEADAVIEVNNDITEARRAGQERQRADALLRTIIETAPSLIYAKDRDGRMLLANHSALDLIGKPWAEIAGRTDQEFLADKAQAEAVMANDRDVMEQGVSREVEELAGSGKGHARVWLSTKSPLRDADGRVIGLVGVSIEITERKRAEERLRLLVHELNHRVKNTLATVQAIASQTLRATNPKLRDAFEGRLLALSAAHDVLTREAWTGAALDEVVDAALAPFGARGDGQFSVAGSPIRLQPRAALALTMALHELATNAIKYGALSMSGGRVDIGWDIGKGVAKEAGTEGLPVLYFTWTERGGPAVTPSVHRGFGTRLIERSLAQDLGGKVLMEFAPEGVTCRICAPVAQVAAVAEVLMFPRVGGSMGGG